MVDLERRDVLEISAGAFAALAGCYASSDQTPVVTPGGGGTEAAKAVIDMPKLVIGDDGQSIDDIDLESEVDQFPAIAVTDQEGLVIIRA